MECSDCGKPLANGIDTFGDVDAPLCQSCFFDDGGSNARIADLKGDLNNLDDELDDLEREMDALQSQIDNLQEKRNQVDDEIEQLKTKRRGVPDNFAIVLVFAQ